MTTITQQEIKNLARRRRQKYGLGLQGGYETIANWLFREHGVVVSTSWLAKIIQEERAIKNHSGDPEWLEEFSV